MPVQDLLHYIDACPTPFHAVAESAKRLEAAGYRRLDEAEAWDVALGDKVYLARGGGSLAAFHLGSAAPREAGFQLVGAHTDSPNLRIKPNPQLKRSGYEQLGVEPYGGVLLHTWIDRDLSIAGRALLANGATELIDFQRALARVPSLAIHLNRGVNTDGLVLNAQKHMAPVLALEGFEDMDLRALLAAELSDVAATDILAWDLMAYDIQPATLSGVNQEFIHAARIDNLASCHAALTALLTPSSETRAASCKCSC